MTEYQNIILMLDKNKAVKYVELPQVCVDFLHVYLIMEKCPLWILPSCRVTTNQ